MADLFAPVKVETIPLLSPTMESELMREPWSFPREDPAGASLGLAPPTVPGRPASGARLGPVTGPASGGSQLDPAGVAQQLNAWEENFQDLSTWCMAGVHARTDFHAGESTIDSKLTGSRNDGSDILTDGVTRGQLMQQQQQQHATGKKMMQNGEVARRPKPATYVVPPELDHAYHVAGQQPQQQQPLTQMYFNNNNNNINLNNLNNLNNNNNNISTKRSEYENGNVWLNAPPIKTMNNNGAVVWQDLGISPNNGMMIPQQQDVKVEVIPRVNEDVLQTFEADAAGSFDLLSYLCEDMVFQEDVPSPVDSASTDSSRVADATSLPVTSEAMAGGHVVVSPRTYEPISLAPKPEPAAPEPRPSRRNSNYQLRTIVKLEKPESPEPPERRKYSTRGTRRPSRASSSASSGRGKGRKRLLDCSDSDEDDGDEEGDEGYRETREKNNEASRKSRMNKKAKELEMARRAVELEKDNRILKMKVDELEKLVNSMRNALLRSALRRDPLVKPF